MTDINNILFPTDFSDDTKNAITFALQIARISNATLHVMHSIEEPYDFSPMVEDVKDSLSQRVKKLFDSLEKEIKKDEQYRKLEIETCMQTGRALYTILEETQARDIDFIVMGARGRTGLKKFFFGSTTAEIVQRAEVPVLAVPGKVSYDGFKQMMFSTDYQDGDLKALQFVTDFAQLFDSDISIFHASPKNDLKRKIMSRGFQEIVKETMAFDGIDFEDQPAASFPEAIEAQLQKRNPSLLIMVRYQDSLGRLTENETRRISYSIKMPLLVLPGKQLISNTNKQP